jgi:predicted naringenin-chalcone synthase
MIPPIFLHKISPTVPENGYTQEFALNFMKGLVGKTEVLQKTMTRIYQATAIEKRYSVISDYGKDPSEYTFYPKNASMQPEPSTLERNTLFIREANPLSLKSCQTLLQKLQISPDQITHLLTVSCTGFSAPGFDLHLIKHLKLSSSIIRFQLGFMGCYAGFSALKLAHSLCLAHPNAKVLIVHVELCTLHFQQKTDMDTLIANALFADGVASALVSRTPSDSSGPCYRLHHFHSCVLPDSEMEMTWDIGNSGFNMHLSAQIPKIFKTHSASIFETLFQTMKISKENIRFWAIHPGGRAILEKIQEALDLEKTDLAPSYEILRQYGNMSSSTILFLLDFILSLPDTGLVFAAGFGPGLTLESAILEKISHP